MAKTFAGDTFASKTFTGDTWAGPGGSTPIPGGDQRTFGSDTWRSNTFAAGHWRGFSVGVGFQPWFTPRTALLIDEIVE